ncbi:RsmB/NOP family class I SAM-dependent RNA methyltransferase [Oleispirillum naphthae]|uniref:RsmB/NOP family class I SAM-dependent RNA methyltransferase n=1 Tax=Oleispirillum naphthae TaxID=2838853 RepID=UPI00308254E4
MPHRAAAYEILKAVLDRRQPMDEAFSRLTRELPVRDRAFARALVALALRRKGEIDAVIDACLGRPLPPSARGVRHVLAIGLTQAFYMGTSPHAVSSTSVALARDKGFFRQSGLVNAVIRRVQRDPSAFDSVRRKAANLPDWLLASWTSAYGEETARRIAGALLAEPPLDISLRNPAEAEDWAARLEATVLPTGSLRLRPAGPLEELPGFAGGAWWVQDAAAALPARLFGDVAGKRVLDLCAAPGGKTLQLAAAGANVTALDRSAARLDRLRENLARTGLAAEIVAADAAAWTPPEPFDAVLMDAPCSATGTLRRHPDAAWIKSPADVASLAETQKRLLADAARLVKPGGTLVYCVCSLQPEEETAAPPPGFAPAPISAAEIGGWDFALRPDGALRTLPCHLPDAGGLDGFFAARFRRG